MRGVNDYRALGSITKKNSALIHRTDEMLDCLGVANVLSWIDSKKGFHQIIMKRNDVDKTAFNTKYEQFEYLFMPIGAYNAPGML